MRLDRKVFAQGDAAAVRPRCNSMDCDHAALRREETSAEASPISGSPPTAIPFPRLLELRRQSLDGTVTRPKLLSPIQNSRLQRNLDGASRTDSGPLRSSPKGQQNKVKRSKRRLRSPPPKPVTLNLDDDDISGSEESLNQKGRKGQQCDLSASKQLPPLDTRPRSKSISIPFSKQCTSDIPDPSAEIHGSSYPPKGRYYEENFCHALGENDNGSVRPDGCDSPLSLCKIPLRLSSPIRLTSILKPISCERSTKPKSRRKVTFEDLLGDDSLRNESGSSGNRGEAGQEVEEPDGNGEAWFQELAQASGRRNSLPPLHMAAHAAQAARDTSGEGSFDQADDNGVVCEVVHSFTPRRRSRPR